MQRNSSEASMRGRATGTRVLAAALTLGLAGCSLLGGKKEPVTIYAPEPRVAADPSWPTVDWQLVVAQPQASRMVDSSRIAVRPTPGELQVYKGVAWSRPPTEQLEDLVVRTLEDSGHIGAVARSGNSAKLLPLPCTCTRIVVSSGRFPFGSHSAAATAAPSIAVSDRKRSPAPGSGCMSSGSPSGRGASA